MREVAVSNFRSQLAKHAINTEGASCLDVGGTDRVYLESTKLGRRRSLLVAIASLLRESPGTNIGTAVVTANPLTELFHDVTYLDGGYSVSELGGSADIQIDFLDPHHVEPLSNKFDFVTCFDTLEHVSDPKLFCSHLLRAAKPGGYVFASTVFSYPYHPSPQDYFRFSPEGLALCFSSAPEETIEYGWEPDGAGVFALSRRSPGS